MAMNVRDLIPWNRNANQAPAIRGSAQDPFLSLHREVNRLFDDVFRGFGPPAALGSLDAWSAQWPTLEISETEKDIRVTAEVPGLDEKDVEVLLEDGVLTIRGEKKAEIEDKDRHFSERFYGHFERRMNIVHEVEQDKVEAVFKNGVLKITLPKTEKARSQTKRIEIKAH